MSSFTAELNRIVISENPEVYLTETTLIVKDKEYDRANIYGCRVEEVDSFGETDLFYSNEAGPGKVASKGLKVLLGLFGTLNVFRDLTNTGDNSARPAAKTSDQDANPPLYCLALLTDDDEIQVLPTINRLLLLDLAARLNQEMALELETTAAR